MSAWIDFRALRAKLDFEQILRHYGVEIKKRGDQHHGYCPLPNHQGKKHSPSFSAHLTRGIFQCFGCKAKGNILDFACLMERADPLNGAALRGVALSLQSRFAPGVAAPSKEEHNAAPKASRQSPSGLPVGINIPLDFELKNLDASHRYLKSRNLSPETVKRFGLGYCSRGLLSGRVAIPLHDQEGRLIGYAGRLVDEGAIDEEHPKYKFPPPRERGGKRFEFRKSVFLYNGYRIPAPVSDLIVVEGFPSVWHLVERKFENVVSTMGSDMSEAQADLIEKLVMPGGRIWLIFDGDPAGERGAKSALVTLGIHRFVQWVKLEPNTQPTDYAAGFFEEIVSR